MEHELITQIEPTRGSHSHAVNGAVLSNPSKSNISEAAFFKASDEVSLGPGLGFTTSSIIDQLTSFHGYLASGVFIGLQMLALGRQLLGVDEDMRIHVVCETYKCLPDAFQYMAGTTIGNKGLIIRDTGKLAATITRHTPPWEDAPGIRIIFDTEKAKRFPKLYRWHMKIEKVPHDEVIPILMEAGNTIYSYDLINVPVSARQKNPITICTVCGESFIQLEEGISCCVDCSK
ncbi:MAG: FmdE family protein [Anaerolineales bacterium]|nr:FmdE family protein [Anaerolineales bacterium]